MWEDLSLWFMVRGYSGLCWLVISISKLDPNVSRWVALLHVTLINTPNRQTSKCTYRDNSKGLPQKISKNMSLAFCILIDWVICSDVKRKRSHCNYTLHFKHHSSLRLHALIFLSDTPSSRYKSEGHLNTKTCSTCLTEASFSNLPGGKWRTVVRHRWGNDSNFKRSCSNKQNVCVSIPT